MRKTNFLNLSSLINLGLFGLENGLIDEVKSLTKYQKLVPLQTVGYTEIFKYLEGTWGLNFAIEEIKKNSRRYAKRQETWNRKVVVS